MTNRRDSRRPLPLDGKTGPAPRISRNRAAAMVELALRGNPMRVVDSDAPTVVGPDACGARPMRAPETIDGRGRRWNAGMVAAMALAVPLMVAGAVHLVTQPERALLVELVKANSIALAQDVRPEHAIVAEPASIDSAPAIAPEPRASASAPRHTSAEQMLREADELRARSLWFAAEQMYERTIRARPRKAQALSAMVSAGLLRLDHLGDARGALRLLTAALRAHPEGALLEEAQWGEIESYRALGDQVAEKRAIEEFIKDHPSSLLTPQARERLRDWDSTP